MVSSARRPASGHDQFCGFLRGVTTPDDEPLMTGPEVAEMLRLHPGTVERWRREGHGPAWSRLGRQARYRRSEVHRWLIEQERAEEYRRTS